MGSPVLVWTTLGLSNKKSCFKVGILMSLDVVPQELILNVTPPTSATNITTKIEQQRTTITAFTNKSRKARFVDGHGQSSKIDHVV